jgi:hypothetical protein
VAPLQPEELVLPLPLDGNDSLTRRDPGSLGGKTPAQRRVKRFHRCDSLSNSHLLQSLRCARDLW